jgi:hypothetical protein
VWSPFLGVGDREAHQKLLFHCGTRQRGGEDGERPEKRLRRPVKWSGRSGTSPGCSQWC